LSVLLLLLWFAGYLAMADFAYSIHSKWFNLTRHEFEMMNYFGMALVKMIAVMFFGVPYLAIWLVRRGQRSST
jgi:hypothetical protein